ncbi:MAG: heat shock protein HtpX [Phycisphaerales bacterium]|nr:heat shock protein HtpX [Phycisphaerales bacterium]
MSRLLLLFVCLLWMTGAAEGPAAAGYDLPRVGLFLAAQFVAVLAVGGWCRVAARRVSARTFARSARRLGWVLLVARLFIVGWFACGVFSLGWAGFVMNGLGLNRFQVAWLPALVVGTLPAVLAWVGLWWAQFPLDHELRQQGLTESLIDGLPVHAPPGLGAYLLSNVRLQLLFTVLPVMLIVAVRDVAAVVILPQFDPPPAALEAMDAPAGGEPAADRLAAPPRRPAGVDAARDQAEGLIWLGSAGLVFLLAPEVLRRILQTSPMPDGPLRRRLEALCRRSGMRVRDILVWHTHHHVGNAAVMGLVPRVRYVLLSDLLLERMDDEQVEAVFAHEVGHVVHRHMAWYVVFFLIMLLVSLGPAALAKDWLARLPVPAEAWTLLSLAASTGAFWLVFGFLSRRFERQADVYAARMMEAARPADPAAGADALSPLLGMTAADRAARAARRDEGRPRRTPIASHVGTYGAQLFASALHRVATINNMPVNARARRGPGVINHIGHTIGSLTDLAHDWLHGSIPTRMNYLRTISADPSLTTRFDRLMGRLYGLLLFVLIASAAYVVPMLVR